MRANSAVDDAHDDDDRDEAEEGNRRQGGRKSWVGNSRQRADDHVLRVAGDGGDAAAVGRGGGGDQIGNGIAIDDTGDVDDDRRHDQADGVVDQERRQHAGQQRHHHQQHERRVRMLDSVGAKRPEGAGHLQMRHHDHHAEQQRNGVEIDGAIGIFHTECADGDHRRPPQQGDPCPVETEAWNTPDCDAGISQDKDQKCRCAHQCHWQTSLSKRTDAGTDCSRSGICRAALTPLQQSESL